MAVPVRSAAAELARRLTSGLGATTDDGGGPIVAVVLGSAGSGRSGVLDAAAAVVERVARPLVRVDDAHDLDDAALDGLARPADGSTVTLVSWTDPHEPRDAFASLLRSAGRRRLLIELGPLSDEELAAGVAARLGAPPDRLVGDWLREQSAGLAWLSTALVDALELARLVNRGRFSGQPPRLDDEALTPVVERVRAELRALPASVRPALAAIAASAEAEALAEVAVAAADPWRALCAAGLVGPSGVAPLVRAAASDLLSPAERAGGHQAISRLLAIRGIVATVRAEHAWAGRAQGDEAADGFVDAGFSVLADDPGQAAEWFRRAAATAPSGSVLQPVGHGAEAEALAVGGDLPAAVEQADYVLGRWADEPHAAAAIALAAGRRSLWEDAARWSARVRGHHGVPDGWWRWQEVAALLLAGRVAEADVRLAELGVDDTESPVVQELRDVTLVLRASLRADRAGLLEARRTARGLVAAQALAQPPVVAALSPGELLAAAALALGEPEGARQAFAGGAGREGGESSRREALARWSVLRCGDLVKPVTARRGDAERSDGRLDVIDPVALGVEAALARRNGDVAASGAVGRALVRLLGTLHLDLLNLDPVTELLVVARRFAPPPVADEFDTAIATFIEGIGGAPAWSARWHWARLEAAIVAGQGAAALEEPAAALAAIASVLPGIAALADAATVWLDVLGGRPEPIRLDAAVRDLRTSGHVWEAAQLAGQAAIRVEDASLAKSLLGQARSLRGAAPVAQASAAAPVASTAESGSLTPAGLSDREIEVARLVLNGLTHKAIGATLYISPKTVEHHVAHIRQKLGATNRAEFLAALREDLVALSDL